MNNSSNSSQNLEFQIELKKYKIEEPFIFELIEIEEEQNREKGKSPRKLREKYSFEFKVWLQEMYEEMMLGQRSPRILGPKSLTKEHKQAEEIKEKTVIKLEKFLHTFFKKAYENSNTGLLKKLFIINRQYSEIFSDELPFEKMKKNDTLFFKIALELFNTLITVSDNSENGAKKRIIININEFISVFQKRLSNIFKKIESSLSLNKDKLNNNTYEDHLKIIKKIIKDGKLGTKKETNTDISLRLSYNILLFLIIEGHISLKVGDSDDIERLLLKKNLPNVDYFGSAPNMGIINETLLPKKSVKEEVFRQLQSNKKKAMYSPPKNHLREASSLQITDSNIPKYKYSGGYLNKGNWNTINSSNQWDNIIRDEEININVQKVELGSLTINSLNKLQKTQWEINLEFLRAITKFKGETEVNTEIKKLNSDYQSLEFLEWIVLSMNNQIKDNKNKLKIKSYLNKKNNWENILQDVSKIIRNTGNVFWHSWHVGPRTRLYPNSPNLSPIGDDFSKALIRFKEWKPLGEKGFFWLKIHLYNHFKGVGEKEFSPKPGKKSTFEERVAWVDKNKEKFLEIAKNPEYFQELLGFKEDIFNKKDTFCRLAILLEYNRIFKSAEKHCKKLNQKFDDLSNNEKMKLLKL